MLWLVVNDFPACLCLWLFWLQRLFWKWVFSLLFRLLGFIEESCRKEPVSCPTTPLVGDEHCLFLKASYRRQILAIHGQWRRHPKNCFKNRFRIKFHSLTIPANSWQLQWNVMFLEIISSMSHQETPPPPFPEPYPSPEVSLGFINSRPNGQRHECVCWTGGRQ